MKKRDFRLKLGRETLHALESSRLVRFAGGIKSIDGVTCACTETDCSDSARGCSTALC
jgi:hypothetical protein